MLALSSLLAHASNTHNFAQADGGAEALLGGLGLFLILLFLAVLAFSIWMLVDAAIKPVDNKVLWIILIVFFGFLPAVIYYFTDRKKYQDSLKIQHTQPATLSPQGTAATWPTTSPTANTETPNPTDKPAEGNQPSQGDDARSDDTAPKA